MLSFYALRTMFLSQRMVFLTHILCELLPAAVVMKNKSCIIFSFSLELNAFKQIFCLKQYQDIFQKRKMTVQPASSWFMITENMFCTVKLDFWSFFGSTSTIVSRNACLTAFNSYEMQKISVYRFSWLFQSGTKKKTIHLVLFCLVLTSQSCFSQLHDSTTHFFIFLLSSSHSGHGVHELNQAQCCGKDCL